MVLFVSLNLFLEVSLNLTRQWTPGCRIISPGTFKIRGFSNWSGFAITFDEGNVMMISDSNSSDLV